MKTLYFLGVVALLIAGSVRATIINVPDDQPTIQAGINAATDGDTVLVQPGTYLENISWSYRDITVASLFLITQDTSYISQTVIDGNQNRTVVSFGSGLDSTAVLTGFTITNGEAEDGGGISCNGSTSPRIEYVTIIGNSADSAGGGLWCGWDASPQLLNVTISGNTAGSDGGGVWGGYDVHPRLENVTISGNTANGEGGGFWCGFWGPSASLDNVNISENTAGSEGGGIYCQEEANLSLAGVTIRANTAAGFGGGIYCDHSALSFDSVDRCNIHSNSALIGNDLCVEESPSFAVVVDTFTVMNPTDYYALPADDFTFDILHAKIELVDSDLYVSPEGDDSNSGQSADEPLLTIRHAFSEILVDSLNPHTINLADGVYSPSTTGEPFPVCVLSHTSLHGESEAGAILDAEGQNRVMIFAHSRASSIQNLTVTGGANDIGGGLICYQCNPAFTDMTVSGNTATYYGGGITCSESSPNLVNVTVSGNTAYVGGGIFFQEDANPTLNNVTVSGNTAYVGGGVVIDESDLSLVNVRVSQNTSQAAAGGIYCESHSELNLADVVVSQNSTGGDGGGIYCEDGDKQNLVNVTITENTAQNGGGLYCEGSNPVVLNTILWNNSPQEIYVETDSITVVYSDIQGGYPGEGNIDADPLFVDEANGDFHLSDASPCIGAGTDSIQIDRTWYYAPPYDMDGNPRPDPPGSSPDMGAYENALGVPLMALTGTLPNGLLVLQWTPCTGAASYWVYGASNDVYFEPGFAPPHEHRLAVLLPWITMWSSSNGIGDPENNWTYLVLAVDDADQEMMRSNYCGEQDFEGNIP